MYDKANRSLTDQYLLDLTHGLNKLDARVKARDVVVVGAGVAGMITAQLLRIAGFNVTVLEANGNRIGGRVKTFRNFSDRLQYAEAGAMRLPDEHKLVHRLIELYGLSDKKQRFWNVDVPRDAVNWTPGMDEPEQTKRTFVKANDIRMRRIDYENHKSNV